jgi:ATP-dependent Clp protease ATP-binding subunit ClpC
MTFDPFSRGLGDTSFDEILERFFGGDPFGRSLRSRPIDRVDLSRLLSEQSRELLAAAATQASEWGSADVDVEHLVWAATQQPTTRQLLEGVGIDPDDLARRMEALVEHGEPLEGMPALTPAAKRALLDAHTQARAAGASYIGPEHMLLAVASNPETPAGRALAGATQGIRPSSRGAGRVSKGSKSSTTPTLDLYGRDLTAMARDGALDPVVGRDDEVQQTLEVLSRRTKNNPVLIGEPGVGKTAIVEGIA